MKGIINTLSFVLSLHEYTGLLKNNNKYSQKSLSHLTGYNYAWRYACPIIDRAEGAD